MVARDKVILKAKRPLDSKSSGQHVVDKLDSTKQLIWPRCNRMLNLETQRSRSTGYVQDLEMARNWELSGGLEWILKKGGASGCRLLVKEPRWQKTRLAPEIQEDQGARFAERGAGQMFVVMPTTVVLMNSAPKSAVMYLCSSALYSVTRNI